MLVVETVVEPLVDIPAEEGIGRLGLKKWDQDSVRVLVPGLERQQGSDRVMGHDEEHVEVLNQTIPWHPDS
jgi:hypothetical protein